jgi:Predicted nucleotide-binding protein containing TIR-like domain
MSGKLHFWRDNFSSHMSEVDVSDTHGHIFVAWGGNWELANVVVQKFRDGKSQATLGGDERKAGPSSFLGENVRQQIASASAAVILVEDFGKPESEEGTFRPNLMLEWGYALSVLPTNLVFPALVGADRRRLPADLQGVWAPHFPRYRDGDNQLNEKQMEDVASQIVEAITKRLGDVEVGFATAPYDVVRQWRDIETMLSHIVQFKRSMLTRHARMLLPNIAIPAVYDAKRDEIATILRKLRSTHDGASEEASVVNMIFDYYRECEKQKLDEAQLNDFRVRFGAMVPAKFPTIWGSLLANNFAGIIERKLAELRTENQSELLNKSLLYLDAAERLLVDFDRSPDGDERSANLWRGFISWNKFRTLTLMRRTRLARVEFVKARQAREATYRSILGSEVSHRIQSEFMFEYLVAELQAAELGFKGAQENTDAIITQIRQFLSKNNRAINRAIVALDDYARNHNNLPLQARLDSIKDAVALKSVS